MSRILAIDYGKKRTGIAVTDPLQIVPGGLCTVATHELLPFLRDYLARESVARIVVGKPTQPNGSPSENLPRVQQFVRSLEKLYPTLPITLYDERFTSVLAQRAILDSGVGQKRRRDKALVDEVSATIILQSFLESQR